MQHRTICAPPYKSTAPNRTGLGALVSSDDTVLFRPICSLEQRQSGASRLLRCQDQALRFERHDKADLGLVAGTDLHGVIPAAVHARDIGPDRAVVAFGVPVVPVRRVAPGRASSAHTAAFT